MVKVRIDNYIRHLELQRKGLKERHTQLLRITDKKYFKVGLKKRLDVNFDETQEIRQNIRELNKKIKFLTNLREELIKNEMQDQKNK